MDHIDHCGITTYVSGTFLKDKLAAQKEQVQDTKQATMMKAARHPNRLLTAIVFDALRNVNIPLIIGAFLFYFLGGYLLYGAWVFAAIGSAVDSEKQMCSNLCCPLPCTAGTFLCGGAVRHHEIRMAPLPSGSPLFRLLRRW